MARSSCAVVAWALLPSAALSLVAPRAAARKVQALRAGDEVFQSNKFYQEQLCDEEDACDIPSPDNFMIAVLGDLHLDPRKMEDYETGRSHFLPIISDAVERGVGTCLVSLGDLGESKSIKPEETAELFAGTTACHELAAEFLGSFGTEYEVIGGNHDLEGIDEFATDAANLEAFNRIHGKPTPQFAREIADHVLLVGLGSTVFREARYTSHEVIIDDAQIAWFENILETHPSADGWKVFVFTHAPPIGSGLRVLQANHVVNGCCWLNHSGGATTRRFIELVRQHRCIKAWFSGHFHLGQDYQDSITFPTQDPEVGPYPNRGSCVFVQTSVMRGGASRDGRQQSRLIRGNKDGFEICTVDHAHEGRVRLDATITYTDSNHEVGVYNHGHDEIEKMGDDFIKVYAPSEGDECFVSYGEDGSLDASRSSCVDGETIAWWKLNCGRVLGVYDGRLLEYDASTLAPLGLVVGQDELAGRRVMVVPSGDESCSLDTDGGREAADCAVDGQGAEQAVLLIDDADGFVTVVQPNEDGSFWRKIVRNKIVRMKEKRRVEAAARIAAEVFASKLQTDEKPTVFSSWGPYTQISGTASKTAVPGISAKRAPSTKKVEQVQAE
ncbi:Metallo-dependent phosphatase-like protein [Pelagophyceae sp. CCMP2097]|nr:Metallo-dependent phosphatase-like protein [Pelagophyceae sp. CCMP2097]